MKKNLSSFFLFIIVALLFVDIGNPNAIRQGTEGFYLLISQEMFEANDMLTPRIYGDFHWSKPPFQFWLPMPFYYIFGDNFLLWGRVSILIFSLACCFLISQWYENNLFRNWHESFGLLLCPLYFIKYARIFMMEMALAYLTTLAALYFFTYFKNSRKLDLITGALFGGLSILVKGPVSLVMLSPPVGLYSILKTRRFPNKAFIFLSLSTLLGSIWFLLSYFRFGDDFFQYFFIRENLGKFNAKNYPISSVIQGLFIYSFPVFILLFPTLKHLKKGLFKVEVNQFFILCFSFFYFLWFLPKQKSHHYAVPAIPILILFISYNFNEFLPRYRQAYLKIFKIIGHSIFILGGLILCLIYYFRDSLALNDLRFYILGCFFCLALWSHLLKNKSKPLIFLKFILPFIFLWQFLLPLGVLPTVPHQVEKLTSNKRKLFVSYRKPFFIQETLGREILPLPQDNPQSPEVNSGDLIYLGRSQLTKNIPSNFQVLHRWKVWKRGVRIAHVVMAIKSQNIEQLQETFALVKKL